MQEFVILAKLFKSIKVVQQCWNPSINRIKMLCEIPHLLNTALSGTWRVQHT